MTSEFVTRPGNESDLGTGPDDYATTVTFALPLTAPTAAVIVNGPPVRRGAVYRPVLLSVPRPVKLHPNVGCVMRASPNWSKAIAVNCCFCRACTVAVAGATVIDVTVCCTVTFTVLVTLR